MLIWILKNLLYVCPPNHVLIFSGRQRTSADGRNVGFRVVFGGRSLRIPILEQVQAMSLTNISVPMSITGAYSEGAEGTLGIPLSINAIANVKVSSDPRFVGNAIERFLGRDRAEIARVAKETLEGHLRGVLADDRLADLGVGGAGVGLEGPDDGPVDLVAAVAVRVLERERVLELQTIFAEREALDEMLARRIHADAVEKSRTVAGADDEDLRAIRLDAGRVLSSQRTDGISYAATDQAARTATVPSSTARRALDAASTNSPCARCVFAAFAIAFALFLRSRRVGWVALAMSIVTSGGFV